MNQKLQSLLMTFVLLCCMSFLTAFSTQSENAESQATKLVESYWDYVSQDLPHELKKGAEFDDISENLQRFVSQSCLDTNEILIRQNLLQGEHNHTPIEITSAKRLESGDIKVKALMKKGEDKLTKTFTLHNENNAWKICSFGNGNAVGWNKSK